MLFRSVINDRLAEATHDGVVDRKQFVIELLLDLFWLAPGFKHESFREEKEWRLVRYPNDFLQDRPATPIDLRFREGRSSIIPYTSFSLDTNRELLRMKLRVGPGPHQELTRDAALRLAGSCGLGVEMEVANQTLRDW